MMYFSIAVVVAVAIKMSSADLVHGKLFFLNTKSAVYFTASRLQKPVFFSNGTYTFIVYQSANIFSSY